MGHKKVARDSTCQFCGKGGMSVAWKNKHESWCDKNPDRVKRVGDRTKGNGDCKYCGKHFKTGQGLTLHEKMCKENPNFVLPPIPLADRPCKFCGKIIKTMQGLTTHEKQCEKNPNKIKQTWKTKVKIGNCIYCNKKFNTDHARHIHEATCTKNPDYLEGSSISIHEVSSRASKKELYLHRAVSQEIFDGTVPIKTLKIDSSNIEFDIYIPSKNTLIEFNGTYWHSSTPNSGCTSDQHQRKTEISEKLNYKLIHISEFEWDRNRDLWKSMLRIMLNPSSEKVTSIYARKLEFREFKNSNARTFLEENHMQGFRRATTAYGLFDGDNLVSMMSFSFNAHYNCQELIRFSTLKNTIVVGGAQKLLKNYLKASGETEIVSYARRDWSSKLDNVYQRLGFEEIGITPPGYQYVHPTKLANGKFETHIKSRQAFQKHKLLMMIDEGTMKRPEGELTERTIAEHNGWYRFYDAGNLIYKYNL